MNILHLSTYRSTGGAAIAAQRITKSLAAARISDPDLDLCQSFVSSENTLFHSFKLKISGTLTKLFSVNTRLHQSIDLFPSNLHRVINDSPFDIVHLYWVHDEFLPIHSISKISKPIVWTLHDHWIIQGSTHIPPIHPSLLPPDVQRSPHGLFPLIDFDKWLYQRKAHLSLESIYPVAPSRWLTQRTNASRTFRHQCRTIPNPISVCNTNHTSHHRNARSFHGPTILFVASSFNTDHNKGYHLLKTALTKLLNLCTFTLVTVGDLPPVDDVLPFTCIHLGIIPDPKELHSIYTSVDVTVIPSIFDNMPQVAVESLLHRTPVVAFNAGGVPDIITSTDLGFLAEPYSTDDLARNIFKVISRYPHTHIHSSSTSYNTLVESVSQPAIAKQYISLYKSIL